MRLQDQVPSVLVEGPPKSDSKRSPGLGGRVRSRPALKNNNNSGGQHTLTQREWGAGVCGQPAI